MAVRPGPAGSGRRTLAKTQRLSNKRDFQRVLRGGRKRVYPDMVIYVLSNDAGFARIGLAVGRKVGGAVRRNRVKRLLREAFRMSASALRAVDMAIVAREAARALTLGLAIARLRTAAGANGEAGGPWAGS